MHKLLKLIPFSLILFKASGKLYVKTDNIPVTLHPISKRGSIAFKLLLPVLTKSSITKTLEFGLTSPSILFFLPCFFAVSLR